MPLDTMFFSPIHLTYETHFCYNRWAFTTDSLSAFLYIKAHHKGKQTFRGGFILHAQ